MTAVLLCGCVSPLGAPCTRSATQEDLLCDPCRYGLFAGCNAVLVFDSGHPPEHYHVTVTDPAIIR